MTAKEEYDVCVNKIADAIKDFEAHTGLVVKDITYRKSYNIKYYIYNVRLTFDID